MKYIIKILSVIALLSLGFYHATFSGDLGVNTITVVSPNTIEVEFSENPNLRVGEIEAEVKILKDISLRGDFMVDQDIVEILLEDPLVPNTSYSLLTIVGAEGSIDFVTPEVIEGSTMSNINSVETEDIDSIEIIDSRNIVVHYRQDLAATDFEYKLLAESTIDIIENENHFDSKITISVTSPFASEKDYILMFIDLQDTDGNYLEFDTGIYDFTTTVIDEESFPVEILDEEIESNTEDSEIIIPEPIEIPGDDSSEDQNSIDIEQDESEELPLNSAGASISKGVNEVAANMTETPDTGAETWVLIIASLFINSIYYLSRRKKITLA